MMGGDPIPRPYDMLRLWHRLPELRGEERAEAIARLEGWLRKRKGRGARRAVELILEYLLEEAEG